MYFYAFILFKKQPHKAIAKIIADRYTMFNIITYYANTNQNDTRLTEMAIIKKHNYWQEYRRMKPIYIDVESVKSMAS